MNNTNQKSEYLSLAGVNPLLQYDYVASAKLSAMTDRTAEIIESYFEIQPSEYREELKNFSRLNGAKPSSDTNCWVFVPCFNEDRNLEKIIALFDRQRETFSEPFELCFILNCPDERKNIERLNRSIEILSKAKGERPYIHIVSKVFTPETASLGRARKYGFDYCLQRIREKAPTDMERAFIVCTEGDTLSLPDNYLERYAASFEPSSCKLVQGRIAYPEQLLARSEALQLFTSVREAVHEGQGKYHSELAEFGGLMPCGRNFAVSPRLYTRVGGVDPFRRAGPEDDIIFGNDISRLVGESAKEQSTISLVTSPRREVLIIRDMLLGQDTNLKRAYEDFHNAAEIRDFETADIEQIVENEFPQHVTEDFMPVLLSQLYQWVISSALKGAIAEHSETRHVKRLYNEHRIGYWEKENILWNYGQTWLSRLPEAMKRRTENRIADRALYWFQHFNQCHGIAFRRSDDGTRSRLIESGGVQNELLCAAAV